MASFDMNESFLLAVKMNRICEVKNLLNVGADVNCRDKDGRTALHVAESKGIVEILLRNKADIEASSFYHQWTPLHYAAHKNRAAVVDSLLENLANIDAVTDDNATALHLAADNGNIACVRVLLAHHASINSITYSQRTPLYFAIENNHVNIVNTLLNSGASVNIEDISGLTPLYVATNVGNLNIVEALLHNGASTKFQNEETPLHIAAEKGYFEIVKTLLKHESHCTQTGETLLHRASQMGHSKIVEILAQHGYEVNAKARDFGFATPIHMATVNGHKDTVAVLLNNGASVNVVDHDDNTPLHIATKGNYPNIVEILLQKGAFVNFRNNFGYTPLHIAVSIGSIPAVDLLLDAGADPNVEDFEKFNIFNAASFLGQHDIVRDLLLSGYSNGGSTPIFLALRYDYEEIARALLLKGADFYFKNYEGITPLHFSADCGRSGIIKYFLNSTKFNYDEFKKGLCGLATDLQVTPLHFAAQNGHIEIVELFLNAVKDNYSDLKNIVSYPSEENNTPLHFAADFGHIKIVKMLLHSLKNHEDDIKNLILVKDIKNWTSLHFAAKRGFENIVALLVQYVKDFADFSEFINAKTYPHGYTPLHLAAQKGRKNVVNLLLNIECVKINEKSDDYKNTALHFATAVEHIDIAEILLKNGADVNIKNLLGCTPLHFAIQEGNLQIMELFIANGVDINSKACHGLTPLHFGAQYGDIKIVRSLLMNGAHFDEKAEGVTPFQYAQRFGDTEVILCLHQIKKLFNAIKNNNVEKIESLLKKGVVVNVKNINGRTPIHLAVYNGHFNIVKSLLDNGADATLVTNKGTLLHTATSKNYEEVVTILLNHISFSKLNAFINAQTAARGVSALHIAAMNDSLAIVKSLLKYGACYDLKNKDGKIPLELCKDESVKNVLKSAGELFESIKRNDLEAFENLVLKENAIINASDCDGRLPLHYAVNNGHINVVNALLKYGADAAVVSTKGNTPLHIAVSKGHKEIIEILLQHVTCSKLIHFINAQTSTGGTTSLHVAVQNDCLENVKYLLKKGAAYNIKNKEGKTPLDISKNDIKVLLNLVDQLFEAVKQGNLELVNNLITSETSFCAENLTIAQDNDGRTLLHYAVNRGSTAIVRVLLNNGADVTQTTIKGNTSLHTATSQNLIEIVEILLQHVQFSKMNDFVNAQTVTGGVTSLHVACKNGSVVIVKSLLNYGACYNIKNKEGKTPFDLSKNENVKNVLKLVEKLFSAVKNNSLKKVKNIIKKGVAVNARNEMGWTPLQYAIENCLIDIVKCLLENGADICQLTNKGCTLLHVAASKSCTEIVKLLLQDQNSNKLHDIVPSRENGESALHSAVRSGSLETVITLMKCGVIYNIVNRERKTPLDISCHQDITNMLKLADELFQDAKNDNVDIFDKLRALKSDEFSAVTNVQDNERNTLLKIAVSDGNKNLTNKILKIILEHNQDHD